MTQAPSPFVMVPREKIARIIFNYGHDPDLWEHPLSVIARDNSYEAADQIIALASAPAQGEVVAWQDDPSADERWQAGLDYAMEQFCHVLRVDPKDVTWDAATEELEGDVCAVIGNILRAKYGEDFDPQTAQPVAVREALDLRLEAIADECTMEGFTAGEDSLHAAQDRVKERIRQFLADEITLAQSPANRGETKRWRHKKRGTTYTEIGRGKLQGAIDGTDLGDYEPVVIYRGDDGALWVRSVDEFEDGRFEPIAPNTPESADPSPAFPGAGVREER